MAKQENQEDQSLLKDQDPKEETPKEEKAPKEEKKAKKVKAPESIPALGYALDRPKSKGKSKGKK